MKWFKNQPEEGKFIEINEKKIHCRVKGKGDTIVVINAIGASQAEWWSIQDELEENFHVITYDRAGYGWSTKDEEPRTISNICDELDLILTSEEVNKPIYLVTSGTGTFFAQYFAATRPEKVAGVLFINPPPINYELWLKEVNSAEDCPNIFETAQNKSKNVSKGIYRITSPIKGYKPEKKYKRYIIEHYSKHENYKTVQAEFSEFMNNINQLKGLDFPSIPLRILKTSIEFLIRDWVQNGTSEYSARQLGRYYEEMTKDILSLSPHALLVEVNEAGENIHLNRPKIVVEEISKLIDSKKAAQ